MFLNCHAHFLQLLESEFDEVEDLDYSQEADSIFVANFENFNNNSISPALEYGKILILLKFRIVSYASFTRSNYFGINKFFPCVFLFISNTFSLPGRSAVKTTAVSCIWLN